MKSGRQRIGIHAARADLAHQVHAHRVAAQGEERRMAQGQDSDEAPYQIHRQRQDGEAEVFAGQ